MEKESRPAEYHRLEPEEPEPVASPGAAAAAGPIYDVYMDELEAEEAYLEGLDVPAGPVVLDADTEEAVAAAVEAERQAAMAADEEMAHALHMQDLVEAEEWELRDLDLEQPPGDYPASSRAGVGFGARATADNFLELERQSGTFESIHEVESGTVFLGNSRIPEPLECLESLPGPSTAGVAASPARRTILSQNAAGSSSSQQVPGHGVAATVPSVTPPVSFVPSTRRCGALCAIAPRARPIGPFDDPVSVKRRALLADAASSVMFPAMQEGHDNGWYECIVLDAAVKLEQPEKQGLLESLQLCLPRSDEPCKPAVAAAGEEEEEEEGGFSLPKFCQRWGVSPSDLEPDAPGPSTAKVPPLADDEVPTFDCGICMDTLPVFDLFHGLPCKHKFCATCMTTYVEGRIRASELPIPCPDAACKGKENAVLHPEKCKKAIDYGAFGDWGARLTESALPPDRRAYCPNRRCGVILETSGQAEPAMAPCPACKHLLCATCGMEWSPDGAAGEHDCAKGPDAALVRRLAQERQWKQCPSCRMIVERSFGCNRMTCRCGFVFCYQCGRPMSRGQPGFAGQLEPCRCHDAGLAFAFAHHHQAHHIELNVPALPPLQEEEAAAVEAILMNRLPVWDAEPEEPPVVPADGPRRRQEEDDGIHQPGHQDDPDVEMENFFY
ncbi:hypothetical protein CFC21_077695 [Triticum aestivum]|uniref:RBR-type E3 ubiquitin transferase n=4 Tax=Triticinae TaxID=1648030 RepID=A0A3B6MS15_WHEAT|nr:probable E3 ubiquitin-protein ligase RNF217 [Aegilops tauschii subsp. strangulata]XP_044401305.1 probable E3 ubiquitin-protein ligase RNF217 [Triticum aestivum]KAF7072589.1 hypothetical protein CFC21_077695 [Triticum aestivum]